MVLVNNALSLTKDNLYRSGMDQPAALDAFTNAGSVAGTLPVP